LTSELAAELDGPYQTLINLYLRDCAATGRPPRMQLATFAGRRSLTNAEADGGSIGRREHDRAEDDQIEHLDPAARPQTAAPGLPGGSDSVLPLGVLGPAARPIHVGEPLVQKPNVVVPPFDVALQNRDRAAKHGAGHFIMMLS